MKPRKGVVPPQLRRYLFKKKGSRNVISTAKRSGRARRVYGRAKGFLRARGRGRPILTGAIGGAAAVVGAKFVGPRWGPALGTVAAGYVQNDTFLQELGGYQAGVQIAQMIPGIGGSAGSTGGYL